ncbi:MAG: sigma-54 dependent transcriptional regulator [Phycisphaeraceae bacterium]
MPDALLVEHDERLLAPLSEMAQHHGFTSRCARSLEEARHLLQQAPADLVLLDTTMPDGAGLDLLDDALRQAQPFGQLIIIGDAPEHDRRVADLGTQVRDYLKKPLDLTRIQTHLEVIAQDWDDEALLVNPAAIALPRHNGDQLPHANGHVNTHPNGHAAAEADHDVPASRLAHCEYGPMLGNSAPMCELYRTIARVAPTEATVLLIGESGTGKELIAQTLHERSDRHEAPMIPLNCGAIPENLIESELFGHEKGSFTGASQMRRGVFERAHRGTLFLDEITEMPSELQVRLLRVLETGKIVRVGGEKEIGVDVRVLAATNRSPQEAVDEGKLREDLLYRLSVFPIHVPPLRDRGADVELLAHHFLALFNKQSRTNKRLHPGALRQLRAYPWPGNVRQLRNVIQRAHIMADDLIRLDALPQPITDTPPRNNDGELRFEVGTSLAEAERHLIYVTLQHYEGDKRQTARTLGVSLKTLYNRLNSYRAQGDNPPC